MSKSTWMVFVVTIAVFCLEGAAGNSTVVLNTIPTLKPTNASSSVMTSVTDGANLNNGSVQQSLKTIPPGKPTSSPVKPAVQQSSPSAGKDGASGSDLNGSISGSKETVIPPGETSTVNTTKSGEKSGVNIISANVLMLFAYVSLCLEIFFR